MTDTGEIRCMTLNRPYFSAVNKKTGKAIIFQPRCKLWSCPSCAMDNQRAWAKRAFEGTQELANKRNQIYFITLTSHPSLSPEQTIWVWPQGWKKLQARARYHAGGFTYLCVPEQHKDGRLHMHLITTAGLGTRFWKDAGAKCGLGYMNEEEEVRTPTGAARYVTKYISKQLDIIDWPKGFRRVRLSRDWPKKVRDMRLDNWEYRQVLRGQKLSEIVDRRKSEGYETEVVDYTELYGTLIAD